MTNIVIMSEADASAKYLPDFHVWNALVSNGTHQETNWVKFPPDSVYPLHSHPFEQTSAVIKGRMRLTVGDEVREVGPGDMWFAPPDVPHGGEILGDEPLIFVEVYSPPSGGDNTVTYY